MSIGNIWLEIELLDDKLCIYQQEDLLSIHWLNKMEIYVTEVKWKQNYHVESYHVCTN